jgi:beta-galactosidase
MPPVSLVDRNGLVHLHTACGSVTFERATGLIISFTVGRRELFTRPLAGCFFRPPTDIDYAIGDSGIAAQWEKAGLDRLESAMEKFQVVRLSPSLVRLSVTTALGAKQASMCIRRETRYLVYGSGDLLLQEAVSIEAPVVSVPRIGLTTSLNGEFSNLRWYGRGPFENYPDRKDAALVGVYTSAVRDLLTPYLFPQENGLRCDVLWAALTAPGGAGLLVQGMPRFHFSALPVSHEDLMAAANAADLQLRDEVTLHIDGFHMGVGGDNRWSINVHPEYRLPSGSYHYAVRLCPLQPGDDPAELGREMLEQPSGGPRLASTSSGD